MRILVLTNMWPLPEQPERGIFIAREVRHLRGAGLDVDVVRVDGNRSRLNYVSAAKEMLLSNFRRSPYDLIHAHTGHCGVLASLQFRLPVVLTYWGYDLDGTVEGRETARTRFERVVFRYLSLLVAGTVAQSTRGRSRIPRLGLGRNVVVPAGVDREWFSPMERSTARRRLGWAEKGVVALFAASPLRPIKRFQLAEAAVRLARERVPDLQLVSADRVPPDEMSLWMNAADVLLLTSKTEGSPNVVKEAMACNLPIVSVDVGDVREVIADTTNCFISSDDPQELADALTGVLLRMPERSNGRDNTGYLDATRSNQRLIEHYLRAVRRRPGPLGFLPRRGTADEAQRREWEQRSADFTTIRVRESRE